VAEMLKPTLSQLQTIRDSLIQVAKFYNDSKTLEKVIADSKVYLSIWNSICQNFVFGKDKDNVNISFTWYDTYTNERRITVQPIEERLSILFNLGTLYNWVGVKLVNETGDRFKEANNCFLTASWIFDKVRIEVTSHKIFSAGIDLTEQNLAMYIHISNAQAIYCSQEKVKLTMPDKYGLLAKLSKQAANCYGMAYKYSMGQPISQYANPKGFTNILQVNEGINMAQAYYWACMDQQAKCERTGVGMGKAVANIRKANEYVNVLKELEKKMNPVTMTQYKTLRDLYLKTQEFLEKRNAKVYFDPVPSKPDDIDIISFGKPISIEQEITQPFEGQAILARMVPLLVQELEEEYKASIRKIINEAFDTTNKIEVAQTEFLAKRNLPAALHPVSVEEDLPEDLWQKINQCKI
jgi:bifunctional DNase/RNase